MLPDPGATESIWVDTARPPSYPPLTQDIRTEVCVIGGGVAGLTTAYLLTQAGKSVTVIEAKTVGSGETSRTTAHLTAALDSGYSTIAQVHGEAHARTAAESHMSAIQRIEEIVGREQIACDFERVDGYLFPEDVASNDDQQTLVDELDATHAAGLDATTLTPSIPIDAVGLGNALHYPNQAQFHPLKYLASLAHAIVRDGGAIYCDTRVLQVNDGEPAMVTTERGWCITADAVVLATNAPLNESLALYSMQAPYRSYVIGFRVPAGSVSHVLLWDTGTPYHYVRVQPGAADNGDDVLIIGGEDHKAGQADDTNERFTRLERWSRARFPIAGDILYRWSGQVLRSHDTLAYLGKNPGDQHVYVITADCCNGVTNATVGATIVSDLITGIPNPWTECYDPARRRLRAVPEYVKENLNVVEQYAAWVTPGDVDDVAQIAPGSGAVIRRGLHKLAVYKALDGTIAECSAVCPHLHCIVDWNDTENTWDCPCHGSRFDAYGRVVNGPAVQDLTPISKAVGEEAPGREP